MLRALILSILSKARTIEQIVCEFFYLLSEFLPKVAAESFSRLSFVIYMSDLVFEPRSRLVI